MSKTLKSIGCSKPIRMWIDGKCFNIKRFKGPTRKSLKSPSTSSDLGQLEEPDDPVNMENVNYDVDASGKISVNFELPSLYYAKMKQNDFYDLHEIKSKTNTTISVPNAKKSGKLTISGDNKTNLKIALHEIHSIIGDIRNRSMVLQFIAIPLLSDEIKSNFEHFKNEILKDKDTKGLDESIFISTLKLHLTVCVFVLLNDREKQEAINTLEEYNETYLKPLMAKSGPLKIHVAGIDIFDDQTCDKVDVLFAKAKIINETDEISLQKIANSLSEYFYEKGLLKKHEENVQLHMTLINTKYRGLPASTGPKRRWTKRESLDATKIMEKYKDYEFGTCDLKKIHLSNISSVAEDGFYQNLATICL